MTTVVAKSNGSLVCAVFGRQYWDYFRCGIERCGVPGVQKPMSTGMPLGVFGLKGLSLSTGGSSTPGPVILSEATHVKIEDRTQVLLKVTDVTVP